MTKIVGFNPITTLEDLQTLVQSNSNENKIKTLVFAALAHHKLEELTVHFSEEMKSKIQGCAKEREEKIVQFVRLFNHLETQRNGLGSAFKDLKEARVAAQKAFCNLNNSDIPELQLQVAHIGAKAVKEFSKLQSTPPEPVREVRSPYVNFIEAIEMIIYLTLDYDGNLFKQPIEKAITNVYNTILKCLIDGLSESTLQEYITNKCPSPKAQLRVLFNEQFAIAKQKAIQIKEENKSKFLTNLQILEKNYTSLTQNENYLRFKQKKQRNDENLRELSTFCQLEELTTHPTLTTELKLKLIRKTQVNQDKEQNTHIFLSNLQSKI